jgi:hypothetical protein
MRKNATLTAIAVAAAIAAATTACGASGVSGAGSSAASTAASGDTSLAGDVVDLTAPGGADAAMAAPTTAAAPAGFGFRTVDDAQDPTFNQLLGVNDEGVIAGYFGSGASGHPNKGYTVHHGARKFVDENFPGSAQTQVTGLNNKGVTVGFWSRSNNADMAADDNTGFVARDGKFTSVGFPTKNNANPPVNQLLGVNDDGIAVGFYNDSAGNAHGYTYDVDRKSFKEVSITGATGVTAAAINDRDQIAGFDTTAAGVQEGFLRYADGTVKHLSFAGSSMTQALGVNNRGEVVGVYAVGTGDAARTHGFTWTAKGGFTSVDDPHGVGTTTVNGVNDAGVLVGFYVDGAGRTHGMLAKPGGMPSGGGTATGGSSAPGGGPGVVTKQLTLSAMPSGTVSVTQKSDGRYTATVDAFGFTPGSTHLVEIDNADRPNAPEIRFGTLSADTTGVIKASIDSVDVIAAGDGLRPNSRFVIRLGANTNDVNRTILGGEELAHTGTLPSHPHGAPSALSAVNVDPNTLHSLGTPAGTATVAFDPKAQTLAVTVTATGVGAGAHAAHIHLGSCRSQGPVNTMLPDFVADAKGNITNQTRTATGVTALPPDGTWYLNLHLGDMNHILANGAPALSFRPLLCSNG